MSNGKSHSADSGGRSAVAAMYEDIIRSSSRNSMAIPRSLCSSPVRFADDSSSDSSPCHAKGTHRRGPHSTTSSPDGEHQHRSPPYDPGQNEGHMDSLLARQALLAAQVFHLVPAEQARTRSYLHGRVASTSLLGQQELDRVIPGRKISVFVGTWNMNGQPPPASPIELNELLLPEVIENIPDMVVVGTQESHSDRFEWEVKMQETIGPTHVLLHSTNLGTLHLAVFIRRDLLWFCSIAEDGSESVRPGTAFRTKGAVAIGFLLFGTSFLFLTAHLTAHQDKVKERIHDVKKIARSIDLPQSLPSRSRMPSKDVTSNFDYVFWFGDLNFRLSQNREDVLQWAEQSPVQVDMQSDQLAQLMTEAYTDRILYKGNAGSIECVAYDSVPNICTSDHKPVWGVYSVPIRPGKDTVPLAAGQFNRDVYLEGIKRRIAEMQRHEQGLSAVCSIQ